VSSLLFTLLEIVNQFCRIQEEYAVK